MKINAPHYAGLADSLAQHFPELPADVLPRLIRAQGLAEYEDLATVEVDHLREVAPTLPPASRGLCLGLIKALHPRIPLCPHDAALAIDRIAGGGWQEVDSCPRCTRMLPKRAPAPRVYDWVAGVEVDPDTKEHIAPGGIRVPLDLDALAAMVGGLDPRLSEAAAAEGHTVPRLLNALLRGPAQGNVRALIAALPSLPSAWTAMDGLRAVLREPAPVPVSVASVGAEMSERALIDLAAQCGLAAPGKRDLLMAWIPARTVGALPVLSRPMDQLMSDLRNLAQFGALNVWLENAARLTDYLPGVPAKFDAFRRHVVAGGVLR